MAEDQKRSRTDVMQPTTPRTPGSGVGVGGRHTHPPTPTEGGGYLDVCTKNDAAPLADPRLAELAEVGLSSIWIRIAASIGVDQFLVVWQILDEVNLEGEQRDRVRIRVPLFAKFKRLQRIKLILAYAQAEMPHPDIKKMIKAELGEELTLTHIQRIINKYKIKK